MSASKTILIIEDQAEIRLSLRSALESAGYRVLEAENTENGFHQFVTQKPDLIILDIKLPDGNGIDLCQKIRRSKSQSALPVIMLTGESEMKTKGAGFAAGADQYLIKPIRGEELLMWVEALFRRQGFYSQESSLMSAGDLTIDLRTRLVKFQDTQIDNLTGREFDLLYLLVKKRPQPVSREGILTQVWKTVAVDNLVDVHLNNLRKKIPQKLSDRIQSVHGKGFRYFDSSAG